MIQQAFKNRDTLRAKPSSDAIFAVRFDDKGAGSRVAIKDVIDVKGFPTRAGSRALEYAAPAQKDAAIVAQLRKAGCDLVGKTQLHELAYGVTGLNGWAGTPTNPNYPDLIPGGSSSGSAVAVASDLCDFALGTDTGGSVRVPAACCGVFGLKPTYGRISREGLSPAQSSLDCIGPLTASAKMLNIAMTAMDPSWRPLPDIRDARIGMVGSDAAPEISVAANNAARLLDGDAIEFSLDGMEAASDAGLTIIARETFTAFSPLLATDKVGADVAARLVRANDITDQMLANAEAVRAQFTLAVDEALLDVDVLALPTLPNFPPRVEDAGDLMAALNITALTRPFNLSGHPALAIPLASIGNNPCSLQLVGRKGNDEHLVALAIKLARLSDQNADSC